MQSKDKIKIKYVAVAAGVRVPRHWQWRCHDDSDLVRATMGTVECAKVSDKGAVSFVAKAITRALGHTVCAVHRPSDCRSGHRGASVPAGRPCCRMTRESPDGCRQLGHVTCRCGKHKCRASLMRVGTEGSTAHNMTASKPTTRRARPTRRFKTSTMISVAQRSVMPKKWLVVLRRDLIHLLVTTEELSGLSSGCLCSLFRSTGTRMSTIWKSFGVHVINPLQSHKIHPPYWTLHVVIISHRLRS